MEMSEKEKEARKLIFVSNTIAKKLDFVRNELIDSYGKDVTLEEVEQALWNQYLSNLSKVHNVFENVK